MAVSSASWTRPATKSSSKKPINSLIYLTFW
jgi:hypothetical protein